MLRITVAISPTAGCVPVDVKWSTRSAWACWLKATDTKAAAVRKMFTLGCMAQHLFLSLDGLRRANVHHSGWEKHQAKSSKIRPGEADAG
jgi:hypothetical protein